MNNIQKILLVIIIIAGSLSTGYYIHDKIASMEIDDLNEQIENLEQKNIQLTDELEKSIDYININVQTSAVNMNNLYQTWTHSREEENDSAFEIYRPTDSMEFPISRFRMIYDFKENGKCSWYFLAPNDAHYWIDGTCEYPSSEGNVITIHNSSGKKVNELIIVELSDSILKFKK